MNWSRCSEVALALGLLAVLAVAPVAAIETTPEGVPERAQVDTDVTGTVELTDLYSEYDTWTLHGETALTDVTWTVVEFNAADEQIDQRSYDGPSFDHPVDLGSDTTRIEVRVEGTAPPLENPRYAPPHNFTLARFQQVREGGTSERIATYRVHHFTDASAAARNAIANASSVVAGSGSEKARNLLDDAIAAYNEGSFGAAQDLAAEARNEARKARQSQQTTRTLLFGGSVLVVLVVVGAGIYYWRSRQDDYDALR